MHGLDVAQFNSLSGVRDDSGSASAWSDLCFPYDLANYACSLGAVSADALTVSLDSVPPTAANERAISVVSVARDTAGEAKPNCVVLHVDTLMPSGARERGLWAPPAPASLTRQAVLFLPDAPAGATHVQLELAFLDEADLGVRGRWV